MIISDNWASGTWDVSRFLSIFGVCGLVGRGSAGGAGRVWGCAAFPCSKAHFGLLGWIKVKGIHPNPALWLISAISINPSVLQLPAVHITAPKGSFPTGEAMPKQAGCGAFHHRKLQAGTGLPGETLGTFLLPFPSVQHLELCWCQQQEGWFHSFLQPDLILH